MQKRMVTKLGREMCFEGICAAWTCNLLCWAVATASLFLATTIATLFEVPGMQKRMVTKLGREMCFEGICAAWTCNLLCWAVATASLFLATTIATLFEAVLMFNLPPDHFGRSSSRGHLPPEKQTWLKLLQNTSRYLIWHSQCRRRAVIWRRWLRRSPQMCAVTEVTCLMQVALASRKLRNSSAMMWKCHAMRMM
eukprot:symbB.v1.2.036934.t1/scaffold5334.1/size28335/1